MDDTELHKLFNATPPLIIKIDKVKNLIALMGWVLLLICSWGTIIFPVACAYFIFLRIKSFINPEFGALILTADEFISKRYGFTTTLQWKDISDIKAEKNGIVSMS